MSEEQVKTSEEVSIDVPEEKKSFIKDFLKITKEDDTLEKWETKITSALGQNLDFMIEAINKWLNASENAYAIAEELKNIAPFGDYSKLIDEQDKMVEFLKSLPGQEAWKLNLISDDQYNDQFAMFEFTCEAVDNGRALVGCILLGQKSLKVRSAYCKYDPYGDRPLRRKK